MKLRTLARGRNPLRPPGGQVRNDTDASSQRWFIQVITKTFEIHKPSLIPVVCDFGLHHSTVKVGGFFTLYCQWQVWYQWHYTCLASACSHCHEHISVLMLTCSLKHHVSKYSLTEPRAVALLFCSHLLRFLSYVRSLQHWKKTTILIGATF